MSVYRTIGPLVWIPTLKFGIVRENLIFANIREFINLPIQDSR